MVEWSPNDSAILFTATKNMIRNGFGAFKPQGQYLISSAQDDRGLPHIGQIRVSFEYDRCSEATVIAQMVPNDKLDE